MNPIVVLLFMRKPKQHWCFLVCFLVRPNVDKINVLNILVQTNDPLTKRSSQVLCNSADMQW